VGGASSEKYAITQLITSGKRLVPLLSWVSTLPKKKKKKKGKLPRKTKKIFYIL
jgi:hypothetical protein